MHDYCPTRSPLSRDRPNGRSDLQTSRFFASFASSFDSGEKVANDGKELYWEGVETGKDENCIHLD